MHAYMYYAYIKGLGEVSPNRHASLPQRRNGRARWSGSKERIGASHGAKPYTGNMYVLFCRISRPRYLMMFIVIITGLVCLVIEAIRTHVVVSESQRIREWERRRVGERYGCVPICPLRKRDHCTAVCVGVCIYEWGMHRVWMGYASGYASSDHPFLSK